MSAIVILSSGSEVTLIDGPERAGLPIEAVDAADGVDARSRAVLTAHERGAGGLAIRAAGVAVGEFHAAGGELIDVWGFVVFAAEAGEVGVAEIVGEDENDIGVLRVGGLGRGE